MVEFLKWTGVTVGAGIVAAACIFVVGWVSGVLRDYFKYRLKREQQEDDKQRQERFKGELRTLTPRGPSQNRPRVDGAKPANGVAET